MLDATERGHLFRLADVPGKIDLVNVFRRPEFCADIARDAAASGI